VTDRDPRHPAFRAIRGGYNVHPSEVENAPLAHPAIHRVAVVGTPAPVIGEMGVAFAVPAPGAERPSDRDVRRLAARTAAAAREGGGSGLR
jgi:acyl-CoA synthetase (AMP-forming)/AMP-acid ligase II